MNPDAPQPELLDLPDDCIEDRRRFVIVLDTASYLLAYFAHAKNQNGLPWHQVRVASTADDGASWQKVPMRQSWRSQLRNLGNLLAMGSLPWPPEHISSFALHNGIPVLRYLETENPFIVNSPFGNWEAHLDLATTRWERVRAEHARVAGCGADEAREHADQRALAGAVATDEPDGLAAPDDEIDSLERAYRAEAPSEAA